MSAPAAVTAPTAPAKVQAPAAPAAEALVSVTVVEGRQAFIAGVRHEPGETFTCTPAVAAALRRDGHVQPTG